MAKRKKYQEKIARVLDERTGLNRTILTVRKSWKEADNALDTLEKQFQQKVLKKKEDEKQEKKEKT